MILTTYLHLVPRLRMSGAIRLLPVKNLNDVEGEKLPAKFFTQTKKRGTAVAQWLRCCATSRKVAGSIPDGVIGIFH